MLLAFCSLVLLTGPPAAGAQAPGPAFGQYPAGPRYRGPHAPLRLRPGTAAWAFRTRLREAAQGPPTFAGHYRLVAWGCGAQCLMSAIIDLKTGAVFLTDFTTCCWGAGGADDLAPIAFRADSRLVVFTGWRNEQPGDAGAHAYIFERGRLVARPPALRASRAQ